MASRRNYVTTTEVDELSGLTACTDLQITEAEELIDAYIGPQDRFMKKEIIGKVQSGGGNSFTLDTTHSNSFKTDQLKDCYVEIIGGTGQNSLRRKVTGNTEGGVVTVEVGLTIGNDSVYKIYQLGKFPRCEDVWFNSNESPSKYYKNIPEAIKRATAAQVEYMIKMGDAFFQSDQVDKVSESIDNYSYSNNAASISIEKLIAPKAKYLLRGFKNRIGTFVLD